MPIDHLFFFAENFGMKEAKINSIGKTIKRYPKYVQLAIVKPLNDRPTPYPKSPSMNSNANKNTNDNTHIAG